MLSALVQDKPVSVGSQWVMHKATDVDTDVYEGTRRVYESLRLGSRRLRLLKSRLLQVVEGPSLHGHNRCNFRSRP